MREWKAVKGKPQEVCVWNKTCLDGKLNLFGDIEDYMRVRSAMDGGSDRFLAVNRTTTFDKCLKRQHLSRK